MEYARYQPCRDETEEKLVQQFQDENSPASNKKKAGRKGWRAPSGDRFIFSRCCFLGNRFMVHPFQKILSGATYVAYIFVSFFLGNFSA